MIVYSVKIYKNIKNSTIFFIPEGINQHGIRISINKPFLLKEPHDFALLGATLRECFEIIVNGQYTNEDMKSLVRSLVTGEKSEKKIVSDHFSQVVFFNQEMGYVLEANMKSKDGRGYTSIPNMSPLTLDGSVDDLELGKAIMQTFEACK